MWHHFVNLLCESGDGFLTALGATGLGWWVQGIIWFVATEGATYLVIWLVRGREAMNAHRAENFRIGFYVWLVVMVCVYSPIFGWHIVRAVYDDHQYLVKLNQSLTKPSPQLPELSGNMNVASFHAGQTGKDEVLVIEATINNLGSPTILSDWSVNLNFPDGSGQKGQIIIQPSRNVGLTSDMYLSPADYLTQVCKRIPIATGGACVGWLYVRLH